MFMLDTDTCSYVLKKRPVAVLEKFRRVGPDALVISAITAAELHYGAERHPTRSTEIRRDIDDFLSRLVVLPWRAEREYARARHALESNGNKIGNNDLLIGTHALAEGATLVTNNLKHFRRISGLRIENWVA